MNMKKIWGFCVALACLTACDNEQVYEGAPDTTPVPSTEFKVSSSIVEQPLVGRAPQLDTNGAGSFTKGDHNQMLFFNEANDVAASFDYTYGKTYLWSDLGLPETMKQGKVTAWYPAVSTHGAKTLEWNVKTQPNPDLLVATPVAIHKDQESTIQLVFKHQMHKLHVELVAGDPSITASDLSQAALTFRNFYPTATIQLSDATTSAVSGALQSLSVTAQQADFIVPAQVAGTMEVEVKLKDKAKIFKIAETEVNGSLVQQLESGKTLSLKITVNKADMKLTVATHINGWENQGEKNDNIII